ncbi:uncharacterized protein UTRI_03104 [Ustilago trichophora]|uniref:DUF7888 domain-containing protein n=1 Tax=Ustilago trichophora TaxID=86804 RepID=A0A5C3E936_9BASI|nr:uncharacterized protein UTRI_03104 [Ustilago trichophora]
MKLFNVSLAGLVFCSVVFAHEGAIGERHRMQRIERRNAFEECNIAQVEGFWERGAKGPDAVPGMTAAVCLNTNSHSEVQNRSPEHYRPIEGDHYCRHKRDQVSYDCYYIIGPNTVKFWGDGGFRNLVIDKDDNRCTYDVDKKVLTCT